MRKEKGLRVGGRHFYPFSCFFFFFFFLIVCRHRVEIDIPDGRFSATEQVAASR